MDYDPTRERYAESSSSNAPDDKRFSNKMFKKYSDSFAQYLLDNLSSNSVDTSSDSNSQSADENKSESSEIERNTGYTGYESPTIILLDTDEENNEHSTESPMASRITPTRTTPTRTSSPTILDNGKFLLNVQFVVTQLLLNGSLLQIITLELEI